METIKELRTKVQDKDRPGDFFFQRGPSIYLTYLLVQTPLTPNFVTATMFLSGIAGAVSVFAGFFWLGFFLLYLNVLLDMCDGEVARYKKIRTFNGGYLDHVNHLVTHSLFLLALTYQVAGLPQSVEVGVLIIGVLGALSMTTRLANGELARVLFVKKYLRHPELFTEETSLSTPLQEHTLHESLSSSLLVHRIAFVLYEMHELLYVILVFSFAYGMERIFFASMSGHPILYWLVIFYGATSCLYLVREVYSGFASIEGRVYFIARKIFSTHSH